MELSAAGYRSIVPSQEYLLQGSILDISCEVLLHRLRGLCDNCDTGTETFHDHEMVFHIRGGTGNAPVVFRARRALDHSEHPWHLRYVGQPEIGDKNRPTLVRNYIEACTSENLVEFLNELGFRPHATDSGFQWVASFWHSRNGSHCTLPLLPMSGAVVVVGLGGASVFVDQCQSRNETDRCIWKGEAIYKSSEEVMKELVMLQPGSTTDLEALSDSYLVELSVVAPTGQDAVADDMKAFAEQLRPLVQLEKIDHKRLNIQVS